MLHHPCIVEILAKEKQKELLQAAERYRVIRTAAGDSVIARIYSGILLLCADALIGVGNNLKRRHEMRRLSRSW